MKIIGVLLAGGMSRRFGKPKAFVLYKNKPFYKWAKEALESAADQTVIVSHPDLKEEFKQHGETIVVEDAALFQGKGPMAGIYTVMEQEEGDWYAVLPCDTPKITARIIASLQTFSTEDVDAIIPVINGKVQPLIAMYHHRVASVLGELLASGDYRMQALVERCHIRFVTEKELEVDGGEFDNINDEEAFRMLLNERV